jgi:hypothetical protein
MQQLYNSYPGAIKEAIEDALAKGREEGRWSALADILIAKQADTIAESDRAIGNAYREGGRYVQERLEDERKDTDQRTSQLLNELYHDRSRLEKVVETAANLAIDAASSIAKVLNDTFPGEFSETLSQNLADLIMDASRLKQFADDHSND